jgi:hypothetical protein
MEESIENQEFKLMNWKSILIGIIIMLIGLGIYNVLPAYYMYYDYPEYLYVDSETLLAIPILLTVIAGFTSAYINKPIYKAGIINGVFATIIGLTIFILSFFLILDLSAISNGINYDISLLIVSLENAILWLSILIIPVGFLGISGAFIGTSIKKLKNRINNRQIKA